MLPLELIRQLLEPWDRGLTRCGPGRAPPYSCSAWPRGRFLEALGLIPATEIVATVSSDHPEGAVAAGLLHVVGGTGYQKWAYFSCPCGCGAPIMLFLSANRRPRWHVRIDWLDRPTIEPSVWQTDGCHSHFWVKRGHIDWVADTGKPPAAAYFNRLA